MDDETEKQLNEKIRKRAYRLWQDEGHPEGQADSHWDKATELVAIEDNQSLAMEPIPQPGELSDTGEPIEQAESMRNLGEFPTLTDQGEERTYPSVSGDVSAHAMAATGDSTGGEKPKSSAQPGRSGGGGSGGGKKPKGKPR